MIAEGRFALGAVLKWALQKDGWREPRAPKVKNLQGNYLPVISYILSKKFFRKQFSSVRKWAVMWVCSVRGEN